MARHGRYLLPLHILPLFFQWEKNILQHFPSWLCAHKFAPYTHYAMPDYLCHIGRERVCVWTPTTTTGNASLMYTTEAELERCAVQTGWGNIMSSLYCSAVQLEYTTPASGLKHEQTAMSDNPALEWVAWVATLPRNWIPLTWLSISFRMKHIAARGRNCDSNGCWCLWNGS